MNQCNDQGGTAAMALPFRQRSCQKVFAVYHFPALRYLQGVSGLWSVVSGPWAGLQGAAATEETHFLVRKNLLVRTSLLFRLQDATPPEGQIHPFSNIAIT